MQNSYWCIDGDTKPFDTLSIAKYYCRHFYSPRNRKIWLDGISILHIVGGEVVSYVTISVDDDGNLSFSRIVKI